jgi:hypothetical protein
MNKKYITLNGAINKLISDESFIDELAKELLLDEVLCGECNPSQFLVESIENVLRRKVIHYHERRLLELKDSEGGLT